METHPKRGEEPAARLKLRGARFDEGRIPVDSLEEIRRYQALIRAAARDAWADENDGAEIPESVESDLSFDLVAVERGSAIAVLEPEASEREDLLGLGMERVDELFSQIVSGQNDFDQIPKWADTDSFWHFGESLTGDESLELRPTSGNPVELDANFIIKRTEYRNSAGAGNPVGIRHEEGAQLAGRLVMLDSSQLKYALQTDDFGRVSGRYKDETFTDDLHKALASSDEAPITWITGKLKYRDGRPQMFLQTDRIEFLPVENRARLSRLSLIAQLRTGWGEEEDEPAISPTALIAASGLCDSLEGVSNQAAIFPTAEGGVLVEWVDESQVVNIEFSPDGSFALLHVPREGEPYFEDDIRDLSKATEFVSERVVPE